MRRVECNGYIILSIYMIESREVLLDNAIFCVSLCAGIRRETM